jgi:hypothetical protein
MAKAYFLAKCLQSRKYCESVILAYHFPCFSVTFTMMACKQNLVMTIIPN